MFVKELRELLEVLRRIAVALEQLADDSLAARNRAEPLAGARRPTDQAITQTQEASNGNRRR